MFKPLIVAAPFGNYLGGDWATRTLGTFTWHKRPPGDPEDPVQGGRIWRIMRTVRYNPFTGGWRNKIGLRNPGIKSLFEPLSRIPKRDYSQDIISIHGFFDAEWTVLGGWAGDAKPKAVELNLSCPNVQNVEEPVTAYAWAHDAVDNRASIIVKLPPLGHGLEQLVDQLPLDDTDILHCCNTIPSLKGGISGKPLKNLALEGVRYLRQKFPERRIIGGGGIRSLQDAQDMLDAGADHVAVASCLFLPWNAFWKIPRLGRHLDSASGKPASSVATNSPQ